MAATGYRRADGSLVATAWSGHTLPARALVLAVCPFGVIVADTTGAEEPSSGRRTPPLPEQILTESITDLDAIEPGETEFALNTQTLGATTGGARARQVSIEAEWRATSHLGLRLEPSYASLVEEGRSNGFGLQGAMAWGLVTDSSTTSTCRPKPRGVSAKAISRSRHSQGTSRYRSRRASEPVSASAT